MLFSLCGILMNYLIYKCFAYVHVKIPDGVLGSGMYAFTILTDRHSQIASLDVSVDIAPATLGTPSRCASCWESDLRRGSVL